MKILTRILLFQISQIIRREDRVAHIYMHKAMYYLAYPQSHTHTHSNETTNNKP